MGSGLYIYGCRLASLRRRSDLLHTRLCLVSRFVQDTELFTILQTLPKRSGIGEVTIASYMAFGLGRRR